MTRHMPHNSYPTLNTIRFQFYPMILKTEAIVLKTYDVRETSRIAVFFTRDHGKVTGILKGIRKDHKKFGSSLDTFTVNDIVYYWHPHSEVHLVGQCDLTMFFFPIRQNIVKSMAANYSLELVNKIMPAEEPNRKVYDLLLNFLTLLQSEKDINRLVHIFQVKILDLSGFRPHIDSCVSCQKRIDHEARFSMKWGGLLCASCHGQDSSATMVSRGAVASLNHLQKNDWEKSLRLKLSEGIQKELKYALNSFLVFHLERPLKSAKFLS